MKLESFGISNFKAFGQDIQRMPLKPITLIFGPNSAGKSSLIHSLLWATEAAHHDTFDIRNSARVSGNLDLGGFVSLVRDHIPHKKISLSLDVQSPIDGLAVEIRFGIGIRQFSDDKELYQKELRGDPQVAKFLDARNIHRKCAELFESIFYLIQHGHTALDPLDYPALKNYTSSNEKWQSLVDVERKARKEADWSMNNQDESIWPSREAAVVAVEEGAKSWDTCRKLAKEVIPKVMKFREKYENLSKQEGTASSVLTCEALVNGKVVLKAVRKVASDTLTILPSTFDTNVWEQLAVGLKNYGPTTTHHRRNGRVIGALSFDFEHSQPRNKDLEKLISQVAIPLLNSVQQEFLQLAENMVLVGPLRALPSRHELLEFPGDSLTDPLLSPWKRLRDDDAVRTAVNRSLQSITGTGLQFHRLVFGQVGRVARIDREDGFPYEREILLMTGESATVTDWKESDFIKGYEEIPSEMLVREEIYYDDLKDVDDDAADRMIEDYLMKNYPHEVVIDLCLKNGKSGVAVKMQDLGVGISQIAPVLVHIHANQRKLIAIEQPEIHIHPKLQAELADIFIESALGENKNTFLLETHSEHLILRILRRIRETTRNKLPPGARQIRPEDIAVLYVQPGNDGAEVRELKVNEQGRFIDEWPEGFFEDRLEELI